MRLPVDFAGAGTFGATVDFLNQGAADSFTSGGLDREQILQVAVGSERSRTSMKKIVHQAQQLGVAFGDQRIDRIVAIEETSPGQVGDNFGQGGFAVSAVEGVVAVPQWLPSRKIFITKLANQNFFAHGFARVRV